MTSPEEVAAFPASEEPRLVTMAGRHLVAVTAALDPPPEVLARRRLRNPRLSHLRDGRFVNFSDDLLLVANGAAARG